MKSFFKKNQTNMRSLILTLSLSLLGILSLQAQTNQGDWMLGGSSALGIGRSTFVAQANPRVGYFIKDNFALGTEIGLQYRYLRTSDQVGNPVIHNEFNSDFGIFGRYYFAPEKTLRPFVHLGVNTFPDFDFTGQGGVGLAWFITDKVALETSLMLQANRLFVRPDFSVRGLNVGFHIYLDGKKSQ
jgi:outer membrane protein W